MNDVKLITCTAKKPLRAIEIMDTTLRDGEQTQGVAFSADEKLSLAKLLLERVRVDRVEVASARVSAGEQRAVSLITDWAAHTGHLDRIEVLGFTDHRASADWIGEAGGRTMNLLVKGSLRHLEGQLRKTPVEHLADIERTVVYCRDHGIACNCYPEDWSNGMSEQNEYARWLVAALVQLPIKKIMLPDTLGILQPRQVTSFIVELTTRHPRTHFDFHGHNDYGLGTANALAAVEAGVAGVHATVNGLGERSGNVALDEIVVAITDMTHARHGVNEKVLAAVSRMVAAFSGQRIPVNKPVTGEAVFTQAAGLHADGDAKGDLYVTRLNAERFDRHRTYALGKLSGRASVEMNLRQLGINLEEDHKKEVLRRVVELGDRKRSLTAADLEMIVAAVMNAPDRRSFVIEDCKVNSHTGQSSHAEVTATWQREKFHASGEGNGGFDAFMNALEKIASERGERLPRLLDYEVHIPPGGRSDALVETTIQWEGGIRTRGVSGDQVMAAVKATEDAINLLGRPPRYEAD